MGSVLRPLALGGARALPPRVLTVASRAPGVKRLYSRMVAGGTTLRAVRGGPLKGTLIEFDPTAENAYWAGSYEPETQRILDELARGVDTAWDVGAHIGFFSLLLARRCRRVLAIEPGPESARRLRSNARANRMPIEVVEAAVGGESGTVHFALAPDGRMNHVGERGILVAQTTLDELAERHGFPDLLKIDIEGAELDALHGAVDVLSRGPSLLIEAHSPEIVDALAELLTQQGYSVEYEPFSRDGFVPTRLIAKRMKGVPGR